MSPATAQDKPKEVAWEEVVSQRRAAPFRGHEGEHSAADAVMKYFAAQATGDAERRAWAAAFRKPVEAALEDLRHHPRRAANLLAPVIEVAVRTARHRRHERTMEQVGRWCLCLTRPQFWAWGLEALWNGENVWEHIQRRARWHEVPEIVLFDNRTGVVLGRAETFAHRLRPGEPSIDEMCGGIRQARPLSDSAATARIVDEDGVQGELASRVLVVVGWRCKLVARVRGLAPVNLRSSLQALCEEAEARLDLPLRAGETHGDMLDQLLSTGLASQVSSSRPRGWVLALGGVAVACVLVLAGMQEYRWRRLVSALDTEPGLKVLDHDTSWGRHEISGLRDPLARSPEDLARSLGIAPGEVVMHFKSYLSADEPLASRRAVPRSAGRSEPVTHRNPETSPAQP